MNRFFFAGLVGAVVFAVLGCGRGTSQTALCIDASLLHQSQDGMQGELEWKGQVEVGDGLNEPAAIEVTSKGNGFLRICGEAYRVYDGHDDGERFDPAFLHITFVDVNGDGYRDLVLCGTRCIEDSRGCREVPILQVHMYDIKSRRFSKCVEL